MDAAADAAVADGRIQQAATAASASCAAVDHRHDDAVRAVVEHALDVVVAVAGHAGQGGAAGVGDGGEHVRRRLPVDQAVLDVHGQPVEAGAGHEPRGGDAAQRQPGADGGPARFERLFDRIGTHGMVSLVLGK